MVSFELEVSGTSWTEKKGAKMEGIWRADMETGRRKKVVERVVVRILLEALSGAAVEDRAPIDC